MQAYLYFFLAVCCTSHILVSRSPHRPDDLSIPVITTHWVGERCSYYLRHTHLERRVFFDLYDRDYLLSKGLPDTAIRYRTEEKYIEGTILKQLINEVVHTLQASSKKMKEFKNFIVLKQRDYNPKKHAGLIILKFKEYPFVIKLFMETPQSFVDHYSKGIEPCAFLTMGGGVNRYLAGFTRIKNLEMIRERIAQDSQWSQLLDTPRKWYYEPTDSRFFEIESNSFCKKTEYALYPSVYALICDEIKNDGTFTLLNKENRRLAIELSHFFGMGVDPHIDNFIAEKDTHKIVLVDTEHFPTMIGLRKHMTFNSYISYYGNLSYKCFCDTFLRTKEKRHSMRDAPFAQELIFQTSQDASIK